MPWAVAPAVTPTLAIRDAIPQSSYAYSSAPGMSQVPDFRNAGDCVQYCLAGGYYAVWDRLGCDTKGCLCEEYRRPLADKFLTSCVHENGCPNSQDVASAVLLFDQYCGTDTTPTYTAANRGGDVVTVTTTPTVIISGTTSSAASSSPLHSTRESIVLGLATFLVCVGIISTISL